MSFNFPLECRSKYPLGEYTYIDLPNDYDPKKVSELFFGDVVCHTSLTSLAHRTWYVKVSKVAEFMRIIDSGMAMKWKQE